MRRQHDGGRLTIRERVEKLVDPGSFHELGKIAGMAAYDEANELASLTPSNFIFGRAKVDGRPVVVGGDDFTVRGGSADATIKGKHLMCEQMANEMRLPLIRLVEGSGGGGSVKTIETTGRANVPGVSGWEVVVDNIGTVPRVALGLGSVAGLGAAHLAAAHYSVMVKELSALFVAGPPVVERLGQKLTKNELGRLGDPAQGGRSGRRGGQRGRSLRARAPLPLLPAVVDRRRCRRAASAPIRPARREPWLIEAIPRDIRKPYKMRGIVEAVVDKGSFFEIGALYGALHHHGPRPPGRLAGRPSRQRSVLLRRSVGRRHLPEGRSASSISPRPSTCPWSISSTAPAFSSASRRSARAPSSRACAPCRRSGRPPCRGASVIVRNCFGVAGAAHKNGGRFCTRYAWPSGRWGSLPLEGGIEAAYRADIDAASDPQAKLEEIEVRLNKLRSPFRSSETFWIEEIVDPRDTRPLLCEFAELAAPRRQPGASTHTMRP